MIIAKLDSLAENVKGPVVQGLQLLLHKSAFGKIESSCS